MFGVLFFGASALIAPSTQAGGRGGSEANHRSCGVELRFRGLDDGRGSSLPAAAQEDCLLAAVEGGRAFCFRCCVARQAAPHRYGEVDGRLCAAASAQDEQTFAGCSTLASPDGDIGRPWCYLAPQLVDASSDSKNWSRRVPRALFGPWRQRNAEQRVHCLCAGGSTAQASSTMTQARRSDSGEAVVLFLSLFACACESWCAVRAAALPEFAAAVNDIRSGKARSPGFWVFALAGSWACAGEFSEGQLGGAGGGEDACHGDEGVRLRSAPWCFFERSLNTGAFGAARKGLGSGWIL